MVKCLSLSGLQWSTCGRHVTGPFVYGGGRVQSTNIIRGAADNLSQLQRIGSSENCVPAQTAGASKSRPATAASWAEVAARGPVSNTTTIVDRATDIAAPENMEAETLQASDSAPTPQEDEIGQRGEEAALAMKEERVLEPTTDTACERPHV